jgi:hypothetical protein
LPFVETVDGRRLDAASGLAIPIGVTGLGRQGIDVFGDLALRLRQVAMYANTGSSLSAAFAALALPVMCGKQRRGLVALGVDDAFAAAAADFFGPCVHL